MTITLQVHPRCGQQVAVLRTHGRDALWVETPVSVDPPPWGWARWALGTPRAHGHPSGRSGQAVPSGRVAPLVRGRAISGGTPAAFPLPGAACRAQGARVTSSHMSLPVDLERIAPLIRRIVERLDPEEIWLFGSRAEGRARPDSDYDLLAVLGDEASEADLDLVRAWEITCGLGIPADLVPCKRADFEGEKDEVGTLPRAAYHRGRRIYERTG